jgi:SSS family solute:Na+ symporter
VPVLAQADLRLDANPLDFALLVIYFAVVLGIGVMARRSVSTSLDFLLSGRSLPAWVTGLAFISANLGAIELLGMAANGAQYGLPTVHYYWVGAIPAMVFLGLVMMPFYYGSKVRSVPEFLRRRFGTGAHLVNALSFALAQVLIAGVNLYALALLLNLLLGWPIPLSIVIAAAVVLTYTTLGGLSAAIYNEVLQFFVIIAALLPLTIVGLYKVGGWNGLVDKLTSLGQAEHLHPWPATALTGISNPVLSVIGIVFGLGFVLSFGYWTTNFAEVQRALSAKSMSAARRTPIIGAFPKSLIPFVIILPGMIAAVVIPQIQQLNAGQKAGSITYTETLPLLIRELLPNGMLGIAITGLLASFMAGVAANVSSFNTVFTYDLWEDYVRKNRPDEYYLRVGRLATIGGTVTAIGTAFIAAGYSNIMDYIQALFSFFNAPLFATFILGMFWKRMSAAAGWAGLVAGTLGALTVFALADPKLIGVLHLPGQGASFIGASVAFVLDILVSVVVTMFTKPVPEAQLGGLVYSLTPKADRTHTTTGDDAGWFRSPALLGGGVLVLTTVLYIIFG